MGTAKALVFDPTELPQKVVTRQTRGGIRKQVYYHAPCLAHPSQASYACKRYRWLQLSDLDSPICVNCQRMGAITTNYESNIERLRQRQLTTTSGPEAQFIGTLRSYNLPFERQIKVCYLNERGYERCYLLDFVIAGLIAVEVNGAYYPDQAAKDRRDAHLKTICPYPLAFFHETEMKEQPGNYYRRFDALIENQLYFNGNGYQLQDTSIYAPNVQGI